MIKIIILAVTLSGCAASFQPFPSGYSKQEMAQVIQKLEANDKALAEAMVKLQTEIKEKKK